MAALIPQGKLEVVKDAGHLVWLDQIDRCTNLVTGLLTA
jgi:pimeloyl-ACP methyl ester carboxylesterase